MNKNSICFFLFLFLFFLKKILAGIAVDGGCRNSTFEGNVLRYILLFSKKCWGGKCGYHSRKTRYIHVFVMIIELRPLHSLCHILSVVLLQLPIHPLNSTLLLKFYRILERKCSESNFVEQMTILLVPPSHRYVGHKV